MLKEYVQERKVAMDIALFSQKLFYYTSGHPFLVSKLCKIIDEKILPEKEKQSWDEADFENAIQSARPKVS